MTAHPSISSHLPVMTRSARNGVVTTPPLETRVKWYTSPLTVSPMTSVARTISTSSPTIDQSTGSW